MLNYILKKIGYGVLVIFGVVTLVFFLFNILPGDPARMMLGQRSDKKSVDMIHRDLGLDRPIGVQYLNYLNDLSFISFYSKQEGSNFYLDTTKYTSFTTLFQTKTKCVVLKKPYLRRSYQTKRNVSDILMEAFPNTIILAIVAIAFAFVVGVLLGSISSLHPNTKIDRLIQLITSVGMSLPSFFAAIIIAWLFAFVLSKYTGLSMFGSLYVVDDLGRGEHLQLKNLILPAITLGIRPLAVITELTKATLLDVYSQDYIRTARAKGMNNRQIIIHHALKNALNPVITAVSGWFASLIAGAVFVEYIFDWKGIGVVIVDSLEKYDFPVIMGALLVICILLIIINIVTDILYAAIDPKVRVQ